MIPNMRYTIYQTVIRTDKPSLVINCLKSMNMSIMNVMDEQNNAIKEENIVIRNKYIIAAVLFVILGINLYSAFPMHLMKENTK